MVFEVTDLVEGSPPLNFTVSSGTSDIEYVDGKIISAPPP